MTELSNEVILIPVIPDNLQYWFVRTEGGAYFDDFYFDKFIGIGWDEFLDLEYIEKENLEKFKEQIKQKYKDEERPGLACGQMKKFVSEMKIGDIVMIPSKNSARIAFGRIMSNPYIYELTSREIEEELCQYIKRRNVEWITTIHRDNLDPYLFKMMYAHNTITNANIHAPFIDRIMHSLYIKGDVGHLVLQVTKEDHVGARDLSRLIDRTISLIEHPEVDINTDDIDVKINVQSPGPVEFVAAAGTIFIIAAVLHYIVGGKFSLKISLKELAAKLESDGLIEKIMKLRQQNHNNHLELTKVMDKLGVKIPTQLEPPKNEIKRPEA